MDLLVQAISYPFQLPGVTPKDIDDTAKWGKDLLYICQLVHALLR